jgi:hypothetical protein
MSAKHVVLIASAVLAVGVIVVSVPLLADGGSVKERPVTLDQLPPAVHSTILAEAGDHAIQELEEVRITKIFYEAEWIEGGMEVEIVVAPDGTVLERSTEDPDDEGDDDEPDDDEDEDEDD